MLVCMDGRSAAPARSKLERGRAARLASWLARGKGCAEARALMEAHRS
jgi:hypothetical protein